jgi:hypothetical protein
MYLNSPTRARRVAVSFTPLRTCRGNARPGHAFISSSAFRSDWQDVNTVSIRRHAADSSGRATFDLQVHHVDVDGRRRSCL